MIKIDLHRHVGGSIRAQTVYEILKRQNNNVSQSIEDIERMMTYSASCQRSFQTFLRKFDILEKIYWDELAISKMIRQVCADVATEQIGHVEFKFSLDKYLNDNPTWSPSDVVQLIYNAIQQNATEFGFTAALVLGLKYESSHQMQNKCAAIIEDSRVADILAGIDLIGNEKYFDVKYYRPIFDAWRAAGKGLVAHVGETQSSNNVKLAIEQLKVNRIAHGIQAADDDDILKLAKDNNICFDIALKSNWYTGMVNDISEHPVCKMLHYGSNITIGTDDPAIFNTTLDDEYTALSNMCAVSEEELFGIMENSLKFAFKHSHQ